MEEKVFKKLLKLDSLRGWVTSRDLKMLESIFLFHGEKRMNEISNDSEVLRIITDYSSFTPPVYVYQFINRLIDSYSPESIFDPWLNVVSPSIMLSLPNVTGVSRFPFEAEKIKKVFPDFKGDIIIGDIVNHNLKIDSKYDIICGFTPFGMREPVHEGTKQTNDYSTNLVLKCSELVLQNGHMLFLLTPSFFINDKTKKLLFENGIFVKAVFAIPSGAFLPTTNIASNLVVFSKRSVAKSFVAEISENSETNQTILDNYHKNKSGKIIPLGSFVDIRTFKSIRSTVFDFELNELVKRFGFPKVQLTDVAIKVNALKDETPDEIEHLPNSFYLPKIGNSPAVYNPSNMKIKPKNYYQIQLDEAKANATFVANYFNTEIGKKLRLSLEVGSVILQIPKSQLMTCVLHLPEIDMQSELINLDSQIEEMEIRLKELKNKLWKYPKSHKSIFKELKNLNQEEKLENWIDTLPFPISSILWRYYATKEVDKRVEHLFHFFEAFSEFLSMIMLSALVQDVKFYQTESHRWIETNEKFKDWYIRATFGNWNLLTARLSKAVREYLSDNEKSDFCQTIFGNPDDSFINIITNKGIVRILIEVAELRNKWKGHGGITSDEENKRRLIVLEQQLNELRKFIADGFEKTKIFAPTTSSFEDGLFTYNAKELVGARTPFNETALCSLIPLDRKKLYLANNRQSKPIELLPFIRYFEATEAVYFYMSVESKDIRWISYHYDKNPEILQPADNEIFKALDFLKEREG